MLVEIKQEGQVKNGYVHCGVLSYNTEEKTFFAEASDLGLTARVIATEGMPATFEIKNQRTGKHRTFYFTHNEFKGEGEWRDLAAWWYKCGDIKLEIFND